MIETRRFKNVVIFMQTILSFVLSRKNFKIASSKIINLIVIFHQNFPKDKKNHSKYHEYA